jgi:hypothetical protein
MLRISPTLPVKPLTEKRREHYGQPPSSPAESVDGELLGGTAPRPYQYAVPQPRIYSRRRQQDRRQRHTAKPYLELRCNQDRRRSSIPHIDIEV